MTKKTLFYTLTTGLLLTLSPFTVSSASAQDMAQKPVLTITNKPMVPTSNAAIYNSPTRAPEITAEQVQLKDAYYEQGKTVVGRRVLFSLQNKVNALSEKLRRVEGQGQDVAAAYYASVATINTQLQSGTTPGNPRLIKQLDTAQRNLDTLSNNTADLNAMAVEIADTASRSSYLMDTVRSTFALSGAVEEDHVRLAQLEDQVNNAMISVDRLLNDVNDDITRTTSYMSTERNNLRTLAKGVTDGNLYGKSLANHPFSNASTSDLFQQASLNSNIGASYNSPASAPMAPPPSVGGVRPLAKIKFNKPNVNFEQPIYNAVQSALQRFPNGRFEVMAVHPTAGNAAKVAIESTRTRRNAEQVLRTLVQMGVDLERIDMSTAPSPEAASSEVHIFVR